MSPDRQRVALQNALGGAPGSVTYTAIYEVICARFEYGRWPYTCRPREKAAPFAEDPANMPKEHYWEAGLRVGSPRAPERRGCQVSSRGEASSRRSC